MLSSPHHLPHFPLTFLTEENKKKFSPPPRFSVALVYCDKMSTVASLGAKEDIKNMLDSGGFFTCKDVQQYSQRQFPHKHYGIVIHKRSYYNFCSWAIVVNKQNCSGKCQ